MDFGNGFGALHGPVIGRHDDFGLGGVKVRTPIGNYAIGTVRGVASASVANDRIVRRLDWQFIHRFVDWVRWGKAANTRRQLILLGEAAASKGRQRLASALH